MAVVLTINLMVLSCNTVRLYRKTAAAGQPNSNRTRQTQHRRKPNETALRAVSARPHGAGALMTVFTSVTEAPKASSLPLIVVTVATPAVETEIPA